MSLEQRIAGKAIELVKEKQQSGLKGYRSDCKGLPNLLRTVGLTQGAAFLKANHEAVYDDIQTQLRGLGYVGATESLMEKVTDSKTGLAEYRILFEVAMMVAIWQKRMALSLLPEEHDADKTVS